MLRTFFRRRILSREYKSIEKQVYQGTGYILFNLNVENYLTGTYYKDKMYCLCVYLCSEHSTRFSR